MGWTSIVGFTKEQTIQSCIQDCGNRYVTHSLRGNHLWVIERTKVNGNNQNVIVLFLLSSHNKEWSYKDMTEAMHPYYYSCPLKFLKMAPVLNQDWRNKVEEYHARKKRIFQVGETVKLEKCCIPEVSIICTKPLLGVYDNTTYRIKRDLVISD